MREFTMLLTVKKVDDGLRLDIFWSKHLPDISRTRIQSWLKRHGEKPARTVKAGEELELHIPPIQATELVPQDLPLDIIYQDDDIIVLNKPAGLVVHPGAGNTDGTLVNALLHHFPGISVGDKERPGIVHRLDKNTSGLMIIARHDLSHQRLSQAFKSREVRKIYRALCVGTFKQNSFELKTGHKRHPTNRKRFTTKYPTDRIAHSHFEVVKNFPPLKKGGQGGFFTELRIEIFTGRTHQIRAQLADIGHPILGDTLYGGPKIKNFDRHALHAEELYFDHPISGKPLHFKVPADFDIS
ncbi:MAG: RluA family pseudouridine synthase [Deltaproteobacteria bacterium]|nr:RluA family pseudouridine synthase [Deltaproteobacteria bacterium]